MARDTERQAFVRSLRHEERELAEHLADLEQQMEQTRRELRRLRFEIHGLTAEAEQGRDCPKLVGYH